MIHQADKNHSDLPFIQGTVAYRHVFLFEGVGAENARRRVCAMPGEVEDRDVTGLKI